jgi:16S rRNA (guanine527-N7)-methyltransferase
VTSLEFRDRLARRARRAKAPVSLAMLEPQEAYFRLLTRWNEKINLTALKLDTPTDETFDRLLVEPLAASRRGSNAPAVWFDLGSGGGSPAIPLKIARPALTLIMVESRERKSAFLREAVRSLGLAGTDVENARFEDAAEAIGRAGTADLVTVRAVRTDDTLLQTAG